jgi:hypothetical protein
MKYRNRETAEILTGTQIKRLNTNVSFAPNTFSDLGWDEVKSTTKPEPTTDLKVVYGNGVTQDAGGNWVEAWAEADMFSDTTEDGVTTTKAEHEAAYLDKVAKDNADKLSEEKESQFTLEVSQIISGYPEYEVDSWPEQRAEAEGWDADNSYETILIDSILAETGEPKRAFVDNILKKVRAYKTAFGGSLGRKRSQ